VYTTYRGFIVFGAFDPMAGVSNPDKTFEGRISQVTVLDVILGQTQITSLYNRLENYSKSIFKNYSLKLISYTTLYFFKFLSNKKYFRFSI